MRITARSEIGFDAQLNDIWAEMRECLSLKASDRKGERSVIVFLAVLALLIVLIYFWSQGRQREDAWQSFRQRHREGRRHHPPEQPIDPNFQFDQPSADNRRASLDVESRGD